MGVVKLQHQCQMLAGSVQNLNTNLGADGLILGEASDEDEVRSMYEAAKAQFDKLNILNLLSGEVDQNDAFLTVHAGAGGRRHGGADRARRDRRGFPAHAARLARDGGGGRQQL